VLDFEVRWGVSMTNDKGLYIIRISAFLSTSQWNATMDGINRHLWTAANREHLVSDRVCNLNCDLCTDDATEQQWHHLYRRDSFACNNKIIIALSAKRSMHALQHGRTAIRGYSTARLRRSTRFGVSPKTCAIRGAIIGKIHRFVRDGLQQQARKCISERHK